ncbi:defective in fruiting DifE [Stigmatella sp. ncwal1]|uniref:Defective in fruiting DifE n=1 Tax=Stigmatella ashevillensis TaxID=2995309 RepID=A0ABT5D7B5_9BACT|nr:chemotaxis protein CheW [Stigmatella ashevillena]MDC0708152.1 defective in fruiting DifE [Stigmatella ashevillena]
MAPFESGRRLCLLVEAGETRYAIEATSVMEVALPGEDGSNVRGMWEVKDLSVLLGGLPERVPGMVVVLDVSPTLAVRVRSVVEVADVARAPFFLLPSGLGDTLAPLSRGAVMHKDRLYLELIPEALSQGVGPLLQPLMRPIHLAQKPPERALVFESQGRLFGLPLAWVSQVVARGESFSMLPSRSGPVAGIFPHTQILWPAFSAPALLGEPAEAESFFVLTEPSGQNVGLCANRVLGVLQRFVATEAHGEFTAPGLTGPALFLDLPRMFS